jgi:hypothetical protein
MVLLQGEMDSIDCEKVAPGAKQGKALRRSGASGKKVYLFFSFFEKGTRGKDVTGDTTQSSPVFFFEEGVASKLVGSGGDGGLHQFPGEAKGLVDKPCDDSVIRRSIVRSIHRILH